MEANELRVGNYLFDGVGGIIKVEVDDLYDNVRKYYEPIPIIEEVLLECGFEYDDAFYYKDGIFLEYDDNSLRLDCMSDSVSIKYLHQLQNLYFALTNEELEINL